MTLPRSPITKRSFVLLCIAFFIIGILVDYFGGGLFFGQSGFWDYARTLGYAFVLYFGLSMMQSYYESLKGCLVVVCLLVAMTVPEMAAAKKLELPLLDFVLVSSSKTIWALGLAAIAATAAEVRWKSEVHRQR